MTSSGSPQTAAPSGTRPERVVGPLPIEGDTLTFRPSSGGAALQWPIEMADLGKLVLDPLNVRVREGQGDSLTSMDGVLAEATIAG